MPREERILFKLPPELMDRALDFLHDDPTALRKCALTCRAWVPTCRFHIFGDIDIRGNLIQSFGRLIDMSPDLASYVRNVHVSVSSPEAQSRFSALLRIFPKLRNMTYMGIVCPYAPSPPFLPVLSSVTRLFVHGMASIRSCADIARMLSSFPSVRSLRLTVFLMEKKPNPDYSALQEAFSKIQLQRLELLAWHNEFSHCLSKRFLRHLTYLLLALETTTDTKIVAITLASLSHPLEEVTFDCSWWHSSIRSRRTTYCSFEVARHAYRRLGS